MASKSQIATKQDLNGTEYMAEPRIAVAIQEPNLPRMDAAHLNTDMKLLVDARDQLVQEQIRVRNRLHALLIGLFPVTGPSPER